eukprot:SAG11_NODE_161_length_14021_cov_36.845065_5_plen_126_part_00
MLTYSEHHRADGGNQELTEGLLYNFTKNACQKTCPRPVLPDVCIVYRDGISDSQIAKCEENEVSEIERALREGSEHLQRPCPELLVAVVIKSSGDRYMVKKPDGSLYNSPPGMVIKIQGNDSVDK